MSLCIVVAASREGAQVAEEALRGLSAALLIALTIEEALKILRAHPVQGIAWRSCSRRAPS